ncbi:MAG: hypothetical protein EOL88_11320 [Bacteroidia bacterium]|nr:hypothetical protein [Bacteroidales bacterium]NCD42670.1 hypothetical protein [Bacteroidia bacterium]
MKLFRSFFLCSVLFSLNVGLQAQDLFDESHSRQFANYLFSNGEYEFAAREFLRLFIVAPEEEEYSTKLARSLFLSKQYSILATTFRNSFKEKEIPCHLQKLYTKSLILTSTHTDVSSHLQTNPCWSSEEKSYYVLANDLLHFKFPEAITTYHSASVNSGREAFSAVIHKIENAHYKKPWTSALLSAIFPGSGKAYCGYWKDGLFSFIMIGLSGWQAYSGFTKKGVSSVYGWINSSLALAFYSGNIYGSIKAAHQYNYTINHEIYHHAEQILLLPD